MTTPRTIAGRAALGGMPSYMKRALAQTIRSIEDEAVAPYVAALREADAVLAEMATATARSERGDELANRAQAAHETAKRVLEARETGEVG